MKLITWNMQGSSHSTENKWNEGVLNFLNNGADICCLQECGAVPSSAMIAHYNYCGIPNLQYWSWGNERSTKYILFYPADPFGNRCNLAIVSQSAPLSGTLVYPGAAPVWRPSVGFQYNANTFVFTLHAISGGGADVNGLLGAINGVAGGMGNNWVAGGDYNREPGSFVTPYVVCPPNSNTFSVLDPRKKYDYCTKNGGGAVTGLVQSLNMSDHYGVEFTL